MPARSGCFSLLVPLLFLIPSFLLSTADAAVLTVEVRPDVELVSVVCRLAGLPEYRHCLIPAYAAEVDRWFAPWRGHPAVVQMRGLRQKAGVGFEAPMQLALHLAAGGADLPAEWTTLLQNGGLAVAARRLPELLRDFARQSRFADFFAAQQPAYEQAVKQAQGWLNSTGLAEWLAGFFTVPRPAVFSVSLSILNGPFSYGVRGSTASAAGLHAVLGIGTAGAERAQCGAEVVWIAAHEFCHGLVNPLLERHRSDLAAAGERIYTAVQREMELQAYGHWKTMLDESLVRACTVRFVALRQGKEEAARLIREDRLRRFFWVEPLAGLLARYEQERRQYPDLESFLPEIIDFFREYAGRAHREYARILADSNRTLARLRRKAPRLLTSNPADNEIDVDPAATVITLLFNRPMKDQSWSLMRTAAAFPEITGPLRYDSSRRLLTIPVRLQPGTTYGIGLNTESRWGFVDIRGYPLLPRVVHFKTRPAVQNAQ